MIVTQRTLKSSVTFEGVGVHSGMPVSVEVCPAPIDHGIKFQRVDLADQPVIPALWSHVTDTRLCTKISSGDVHVGTIEHITSALAAERVDNALVKISGAEVPIMDGSAAPFLEEIAKTGTIAQTAPRKFLVIKKAIKVSKGDTWAQIKPYENTFAVRYMFKNRFNNILETYDSEDVIADFGSDLSSARTFGFLEEVEQLRAAGLAKGGSLDNAVVFDKGAVMNPEGLRYDNECARHKALDVVGDLYLAGMPIIGKFEGFSSGHALNNALLQKLLNDRSAWSVECVAEEKSASQRNTNRPLSEHSQFGT